MRSPYDYIEENPLAAKHPGYKGEALVIDEEEEQMALTQILVNDRSKFNKVVNALLPDRETLPDSLIWNIIYTIEKPSPNIQSIIDNLDVSQKARSRMIRILSIPQLRDLPDKDFEEIMIWMEHHPKNAWRWGIGLARIYYNEQFEGIPIRDGLIGLKNDINLPYRDFVTRYFPDSNTKAVWEEIYERVPKSSKLLDVSTEVAAHLPMKDFLRIIRDPDMQTLQKEDREHGAIGLAMTFGNAWKQWLNAMKKRKISIHDAVFWLPHEHDPQLSKFLFKHKTTSLKKTSLKYLSIAAALEIIATAWDELEPEERKGKLVDIIGRIIGRKFAHAQVPGLALIAARCGAQEEDYYPIEDKWLYNIKKRDNIPNIKVTHDNLQMYKLEPDDVRDIWLGCPQFVLSCQKPGDMGEECAWYGHTGHDSSFYVIEDSDKNIVAYSWTWRQQNVIVFDSIESNWLDSDEHRPLIIEIYNKLAAQMINHHNIAEVRVGDEYEEWESSSRSEIEIIPLPLDYALMGEDDPYSDADVTQSIIAQKGKFDLESFAKTLATIIRESFIENKYPLDGDKVGTYINDFEIPWNTKSKILEYDGGTEDGTVVEYATVSLIIGGKEVAEWREYAVGCFQGDPDDWSWGTFDSEIEATTEVTNLLDAIDYEATLKAYKPPLLAFDDIDDKGLWGVQYEDHNYNDAVLPYNTKEDAENAIEELEEWFSDYDYTLVKTTEDDPYNWKKVK
jgi:hypothetical protein